ncbi:MAG TPA: preprotein translocase subunit SecG [Methyloceanibacter sp.]|nr:preprotein translocase subunit SecG [Methyloceanibacter sp.]
MTTVLLLIHVMVCVALVGVVLLQRSEGGALGIGGGGGNFMTGRSAGNALTKTTAVLAAAFFATSLLLSILASHLRPTPTILPTEGGLAPLQAPSAPAPAAPPAPSAPQAPQSQ